VFFRSERYKWQHIKW